MAATHTVPQPFQSLQPAHGVVTLNGYGIRITVDRGHLVLDDGICEERRRARLPRVGHGLRRLVVIGADGFVSLAALRWLSDQDAAFVMLDRDGSVLATTGPVCPSDARLRRAQALAHHSGAALHIAQELISQKLAGQEQVVRDQRRDSGVTNIIAQFRASLPTADTLEAVRLVESQAAAAYWSAWHSLPVSFPRNDLARVPEHWRTFGTRKSPLSGSPRLAANPPNAILNYLYAVLESEARLAAAALGLDPGLGFLHMDTPARDSLACDLMEPVRPQVDAYVLDWITRQPLCRDWFFEQRDGNCRLMGSFAARLSETAPTWGRAVAPFAEWVARALWATKPKPARQLAPATRLTQRLRREARGSTNLPTKPAPRAESICRSCGNAIAPGRSYCVDCAVVASKDRMVEVARIGRVAAHSPEAEARRAETKRRHDAALQAWARSGQPTGLDRETYMQKIQPQLAKVATSAIASALGVSLYYAADIRRGRACPHPRHWQALAELVSVSADLHQSGVAHP